MIRFHYWYKILLIVFLCFTGRIVNAQELAIDDIVQKIRISKTSSGVDTAVFMDAMKWVEMIPLDDAIITRLENEAAKFIKGDNAYWYYVIKASILSSLIKTDVVKALNYGKQQLEEIEVNRPLRYRYIYSQFLIRLRLPYRNSDMLPEGFSYFNEKLKDYKLKNDSIGLSDCYYVLSGFYRTIGLLNLSIYNMKKSVSYMSAEERADDYYGIFSNPRRPANLLSHKGVIGLYHMQKGEYEQAIDYARYFIQASKTIKYEGPSFAETMIAESKLLSGQLDSVTYYLDKFLNGELGKPDPDFLAYVLQVKALYNIKIGNLEEAKAVIKQCHTIINENKLRPFDRPGILSPDYYSALVSIKARQPVEAISFLKKDLERIRGQRLVEMRSYKLLAELNEEIGNYKDANDAYKKFNLIQDKITADQAKFGFLSFEMEQEMNQKELAISMLESKSKIADLSRNFTVGIALLLLVLAGSIYYRFQAKKKANLLLEGTLAELKSTQAQLIQSEKMASLGELTAGIAHEIQNPLNFVNNFSEVSKELMDEVKSERAKVKGERDEALEEELLNDISQNLEKIHHHGKRADSIVKGMLQHSRASTGQKEPTDINALCEEYLRLAYHGMKAKDNSFEASFRFEPDNTLPKLNVVPQDIGRVLLNLINNAFQAVGERVKGETADVKDRTDSLSRFTSHFSPLVTVSTKKLDDRIEISIKDNGPGIPAAIREKIFQPFFTTKPTGEGTGLGLSLSYDIVKAHGGDLMVESAEGQGTTFIIRIPLY